MGFSRRECWSGVPSPSPIECPHDPAIPFLGALLKELEAGTQVCTQACSQQCSPGGPVTKSPPASAGGARFIQGWEDPLKEEMAACSGALA